MSKSKKSYIKIPVEDDTIYKYISTAYGLICKYREANKVPFESMDNWALKMMIEGCRAVYDFNNQQIKQSEQKPTEEKKGESNVK